jgi:hypothetical protein
MFLSFPQWDIKIQISQTFKFVTVVFNFIIVAPFLKFNISTKLCYNIMKQKVTERPIIEFIYLYFHLYSHCIKVYIYFSVEFRTFGFILKKYATFATNVHFRSQYMITKECLTHAHSLYAVLTGIWCLEMKHGHRSWLIKLPPAWTHTHMFDYCDISLWPTTALTASLITDVYYCCVCWICISFTSSSSLWMNELCSESYLFF